MADTILSMKDIEDVFWDMSTRMLGLNPAAPANQKRVRVSWPEKGAPAWKREENIAFISVEPDDDPYTRQMDVEYSEIDADNANRAMSYTRVHRVSWICYGPSSFGDTDLIRSSLFKPEYTMALAAVNMALITDVSAPRRSPELFGGQWWERSNFSARFNEKVIRQSEVPYLQSADVRIIEG
ncbi:phage neck terminator protein [Paenibacillus agricola]|uniref:Phage neck terminator protein gp12-like domain-containing protein n=1 Tax=Paenibacillus agricola TaxID=2716264 RepID=A0ABX0JE69_9BACL|nr:hypothetical protein [Paenibacillus agricola]NHN33541.1 hypothetical protein [Paenibacillus agricola]